jgi:hypothetical protein
MHFIGLFGRYFYLVYDYFLNFFVVNLACVLCKGQPLWVETRNVCKTECFFITVVVVVTAIFLLSKQANFCYNRSHFCYGLWYWRFLLPVLSLTCKSEGRYSMYF